LNKLTRLPYNSIRVTGLDTLRGLAILLVVIFHYITRSIDANASEASQLMYQLTYYFNSGVDLFFVLSGYLITKGLLAIKKKQNFFTQFFKRRAQRILPLYYFTLVVAFILLYAGLGENTIWSYSDEVPWHGYFTFLQNEWMGHNNSMGSRLLAIYWSLGIEIQFYIIISVGIYFFRPRILIPLLAALIIIAPILRMSDGTHVGMYTHFYCRMDSVFAGALIALLTTTLKSKNWIQVHKKHIETMAFLMLLLFTALTLHIVKIPTFLISTFFMILYSLVVMVSLNLSAAKTKLTALNRLLVFLGNHSYEIYITHELVRALMFFSWDNHEPRIADTKDAILTIFSFAFTIVLAYLSRSILTVSREHSTDILKTKEFDKS
jgi:peptidoglycan/LPS O-acetylase OafA/YrhL